MKRTDWGGRRRKMTPCPCSKGFQRASSPDTVISNELISNYWSISLLYKYYNIWFMHVRHLNTWNSYFISSFGFSWDCTRKHYFVLFCYTRYIPIWVLIKITTHINHKSLLVEGYVPQGALVTEYENRFFYLFQY
jgi:hypothetical protein